MLDSYSELIYNIITTRKVMYNLPQKYNFVVFLFIAAEFRLCGWISVYSSLYSSRSCSSCLRWTVPLSIVYILVVFMLECPKISASRAISLYAL